MQTTLILLTLVLTLPLQAQSDLEFIWNKDGFGGLFDRGPQIAYSPDGTRLVAGDVEGTIRILSMPDGEILHEVEYPDAVFRDVGYAQTGEYIAGIIDQALLIIDPVSGTERNRLNVGDASFLRGLKISSDSQLICLIFSDYLQLLAWPELKEVWRYDYASTEKRFIKQADISFTNQLIAIGATDELIVVERESNNERLIHRDGSIQEVRFIPDTETILSSWRGSQDHNPNFATYNARSGLRTGDLPRFNNSLPLFFDLSPHGSAVVLNDNFNTLLIQDIKSKEILLESPETGGIDFAISPDSMYIALARGRGQLSLIRSPWNRVNTDVHDPATHSWDFSVTSNPAEADVTISFTVPAAGASVKLSLFNLRGQLLHQLLDDFLPAGEQHLRITAAELVAKGTNVHQLFCSLTMQNKTQNMLIYLGH